MTPSTPQSDRLNIAWCMPCGLRSGIGRDHQHVAAALARRGHRVRIVATDYEWDAEAPHHGGALPVAHWKAVDLDALAERHDAVVVQIGDNFGFHAGAFEIMDRTAALAVFNDFYLHDLFMGWLWWRGSRRGENKAEVVATYGLGAAKGARLAAKGRLTLGEIAQALPMTEWVARRCAAAVVHADFYRARVEAGCPGPVGRAWLPVPSRGVTPLPVRRNRDPVLLTVGVMNANKCVDRVIEAIAASPVLRDRLTYRLAGPIDAEEELRLTVLAARLGFPRLEVYGGVDEPTLDAHLAECDLIACLRSPVLEGASGSALEALLAGRPAIVADSGFYAELPDTAVLKVDADMPVAQITAHLERLAGDEALRRTMGEAGRAWAEPRVAADAYADAIEPMMRAAAAAARIRRVQAAFTADAASLGFDAHDPVTGRLRGAAAGLFGVDLAPRDLPAAPRPPSPRG